MTRTLLLAVGLALLATPALSQRSPDRDPDSDGRYRGEGSERERDGWPDDERGGSGRGAHGDVHEDVSLLRP